MEARGRRTHFEDLKYGTLNWRYTWTVRDFNKNGFFPARPRTIDIIESPPYYFPSVLAFLCTEEQFNWEIEIYGIKVQEANPELEQPFDLSLELKEKITTRIKGLGIPFPVAQPVRFSEQFVPLGDSHQNRIEPIGVRRRGWKYWTEERLQLMERRIEIEANPLGLTDIPEYQKQWEHKAHGMLLDMAVYVNTD